MREYKNILSLDFEMYNSMRYYSICWIGAVLADGKTFCPINKLDIKVNPDTRHKSIGKGLSFPFTYKDLKILPKFDKAAQPLFELLNEDTLVLGHAVDNDIKMLLTACSHYSIACPDFDYLDTNVVNAALNGNYVQTGLTGLAEKYGVKFSAHDPAEDARASLEVLKGMLSKYGVSLTEIINNFGIEVGKVRNGLVRKCAVGCMTSRAKEHIDNYNSVFDAANSAKASDSGNRLNGITAAFDLKLMSSQNLFELVKWIVERGGKIVYDPDYADTVITSQLIEGDKHYMRLREFADLYRMPEYIRSGLDFYPNKVTTEDGETMTFAQYLRNEYASENTREGKRYCFAHAVEKKYEFEDIAVKLLMNGNRICNVPDKNTVFVVDSIERLDDNSDMKVRAYKSIRPKDRAEILTLDELNHLMR